MKHGLTNIRSQGYHFYLPSQSLYPAFQTTDFVKLNKYDSYVTIQKLCF